jgi:hypothetical protein
MEFLTQAAEKGGIAVVFVIYLWLERIWRSKEQEKRDAMLTGVVERSDRIRLITMFVLGQWIGVAKSCTAKVTAANPSSNVSETALDMMPHVRCTNCNKTFKLTPDWLEKGVQFCPSCTTQVVVPDILFGNPFNNGG